MSSSWMLHSVQWYFLTNVSGEYMVPSKFQEFFTSENGTDRLSRNIGKELLVYVGNAPVGRRFHLHRSGSLKSHIKFSFSS
jgi:hypothetical protein